MKGVLLSKVFTFEAFSDSDLEDVISKIDLIQEKAEDYLLSLLITKCSIREKDLEKVIMVEEPLAIRFGVDKDIKWYINKQIKLLFRLKTDEEKDKDYNKYGWNEEYRIYTSRVL